MTQIRDIVSYSWEGFSFWQKAGIWFVGLLIAGLLIAGWARSGQLYFELRRNERDAAHAKADAADALRRAAAVATEIRRKEEDLTKKEELLNEKYKSLDRSRIDRLDSQRDLDRIRAEPRSDNPSTEQLCGELAALGYPCDK